MNTSLAIQNRLRLWMKQVLADNDISCEQWARRAGVAPTTITRFYNQQTDRLPSTTTLLKLSAVTSLPIGDLLEKSTPGKAVVPLYCSGIDYVHALQGKSKTVTETVTAPDKYVTLGVVVEISALHDEGVSNKDIVFINPKTKATKGDYVAVLWDTKIACFMFLGSTLIGRIGGEDITLSIRDVEMIGKISSLTRSF